MIVQDEVVLRGLLEVAWHGSDRQTGRGWGTPCWKGIRDEDGNVLLRNGCGGAKF